MNPTSEKLRVFRVSRRNREARQGEFIDTCSRCKTKWACCLGTRPPITDERKRTIEAYLREYAIEIDMPFAEEDYVFPREQASGYCVFRNGKTGKCVVHAVKPETCVSGPVTFDINVRSGKIEWFLKMDRICDLAGVVAQDRELLEMHLVSAKRETGRLVKQLGGEALKAILKKDEPETFKIDEDDAAGDVLDKLR
jgi:Fe-S-cluster containining protein